MKNQAPYYFRMFIALGYIVLGVIFLTSKGGELLLGSKTMSLLLGGACIVYGLFRMFRNQKKWDKTNFEN
jgi:hypothetical protein